MNRMGVLFCLVHGRTASLFLRRKWYESLLSSFGQSRRHLLPEQVGLSIARIVARVSNTQRSMIRLPTSFLPRNRRSHQMGWSASTAVRMTKRHGHIRPEAQRQALKGLLRKTFRWV
jgi:hypothetical protein